MKDKAKLRNTIIKWSLFGLLVIATILIFVFSASIFGEGKHMVLDEYGQATGEIAWEVEPMFYKAHKAMTHLKKETIKRETVLAFLPTKAIRAK